MPPTNPTDATLPPRPPDDGTIDHAAAPVARAPGSPADAPPGYDLLGELARGGMGVVTKARDTKLDRVVALKMVLAGRLASAADVRRFRTEAEAAARLDHPNIVPVYEVGEHAGQPYFTMAFVAGGSLADRVAAGPLPVREAAALAAQLADAIQYAHESGVVHRDLKPANVLLDERGVPKVADFGLAKRQQVGDGPTATGDILGTPAYMPPEQAGGRAAYVGPAADIYSLGAVLFALLTGRPPFAAATTLDTILQVLHEPPPRPSALRPGVPRDLETVCLKCLEKEPARRYASAKALGDDLRRFLAGEPVAARRAGVLRRGWVWARKRPWVLSVAAAVLLVAVSCVAYGLAAELRHRAWEIEYLRTRAERLALGPKPEPKAVEAVAERLRQLTRQRPDQRLYPEAVGLLQASGRGGRRLLPSADPKQRLRGLPSPSTFYWSADGRRLIIGTAELDVAAGTLAEQKVGDWPAVPDPSGRWLAARKDHATIRVRDRLDGRERDIALAPAKVGSFQFLPAGHALAITVDAGGGSRFEFWQPDADRPHAQVVGRWRYSSLSADGTRFAASDGSSVAAYRTDTGAEVARLPPANQPRGLYAIALSPDGTRLARGKWAAASAPHPFIDVADLSSGRERVRLEPVGGEFFSGLAFSADGRFVTGRMGSRNEVVVWDAASGAIVCRLPGQVVAGRFGAGGELAVADLRAGGAGQELHVEAWEPGEVNRAVADVGLAGNLHPANDADARIHRLLFEGGIWGALLSWPFLLALGANVWLELARWRYGRRGAALPVLQSAAGVAVGLLTTAGGLAVGLTAFDAPDWGEFEVTFRGWASLLAVVSSTYVIAKSAHHLRVAAAGGGALEVPSSWRVSGVVGRVNQWSYSLMAAALLSWLVLVFAAQDGVVPGLGWLPALMLAAVLSLAVSAAGWAVYFVARRLRRAVPRRALVAAATAFGLWLAAAAVRRTAVGWGTLGGGPWFDFEPILGWANGARVPWLALADALAVVGLAASLWGLYRGRAATPASGQGAASADSGGSGGSA